MRRIPPALGIVVVLASLHALGAMVSMFVPAILGDVDIEPGMWLLLATPLLQLVAGVAIAAGSARARFALLAWTATAIATGVMARDVFVTDAPFTTIIGLFLELLAGPAIVWIVPLIVGDLPVEHAIPPARVVSDGADVAPRESAIHATAALRRTSAGVALVGIAILWLGGSVLSQLFMLLELARSGAIGAVLGQVLWLALGIVVGVLALRAGRQLLALDGDPAAARRAFMHYMIAVLGRQVLSFALVAIGQALSSVDSEIRTMVLVQFGAGTILSLVTPAFLAWYLRGAFTTAPSAPEIDAARPHLARVPAWAALWIAPILLTRVWALDPLAYFLSSVISGALVVVCAIQGIAYVVAARGAFVASAREGARIATVVAFVCTFVLYVCWFVTMLGLDGMQRMGTSQGSEALVELLAVTATLFWALGRSQLPATPSVLSPDQ